MELKEKRTALARLVAEAREHYMAMQERAKKGEVDQSDHDKLARLVEEGKKLRAEIESAEEMEALNDFVSGVAETKTFARQSPQSWGETVVKSEQFANADRVSGRMMPVSVKAIYSVTAPLVQPLRDLDVGTLGQQPLTLLDAIDVATTTSDLVQYVQETVRTNNAAPVPEYDASTSNFGLKPQSDLQFQLKDAPVKTIATWVPASRRILDDAPQLRNLIDSELRYMVRVALENQIVNGTGTGEEFVGILNTSGIQARVHQTSGRGASSDDTVADTIRRAITDIYLAFYVPDAIALNPVTAEKLELEKDQQGRYINIYDAAAKRLWRLPIVETNALPQGTALVGAMKLAAKLWQREDAQVRIGEPNDYFIRNAVAVLAELRAAFGVKRPLAIEKVTGL